MSVVRSEIWEIGHFGSVFCDFISLLSEPRRPGETERLRGVVHIKYGYAEYCTEYAYGITVLSTSVVVSFVSVYFDALVYRNPICNNYLEHKRVVQDPQERIRPRQQ